MNTSTPPRSPRARRSGLARALPLAALSVLAACNLGLEPVELDSGHETENQLQLTINKDVDILLVIDNSGSMAAEQANLAANFEAMIDILEDPEVSANYRIGITTTDNGNPWCPSGQTTPEGGNLVASSCRERLDDFVFGDTNDARDLACLDICAHESIEIQPTITAVDRAQHPRPWLERIEHLTNLPEGMSTAEAFACLAPQGISGCGFESPLESMYLALSRAQSNTEDNYGFLRSDALLAIILITDEVDCSYDKDWATIFDADGDRSFWSDPDADFPTSALCWNAGTECSGDPSAYDDCAPVDKDAAGALTVDPSDAVLQPMSRYIDRVQELELEKQALNPDQEIIVALIGGVDVNGDPFYGEVAATDPEHQNNFGIGPGCVGQNGESAVPPVRNRAFVQAFGGDMFSVCSDDYTGPLETIADRMRDQIRPACYGRCVADSEPELPLLQPNCIVEETRPSTAAITLIECLRDGEWGAYLNDPITGGYLLPDDQNTCYALLTDDAEGSEDPLDDMSQWCLDFNYNMEFEITRRPGFPAEQGTSISANCTVVEEPSEVCPGIGLGG